MNYINRLIIFVILVVSSSTLHAAETADTLDIYVEKHEPYAYISSEGAQIGVFVDYIDSLFENINIPYKILMVDSLSHDSIRHYPACITSQNIWGKLAEDSMCYDYMIFHSTGGLLHTKDVQQIDNLSDMLGYRICTRDKDFLLESASQYGLALTEEQVWQNPSVSDAMQELMEGKHDFIVDDYLLLNWYLENHDVKNMYLMEFKSLHNIYKLHLSANQSAALIRQIDSALRAKPNKERTIRVFEKWFGHPHQERLHHAESRLHIYLMCLIILISLLVLGIYIYVVKRKTQVKGFEELSDILMGFPHAVDIYVDGKTTPDYSNRMSLELKERLRKYPEKVFVQEEDIDFIYRSNQVHIKVYIDVTELENARRTAERTSMLKTQFLANTSHDLRSPLNSIVGFSALLSECDDEAEMEEYAKIIETNTNDLLTLLDGIIELSLLETSVEFRFRRKPIDLNKLLHQIYQEYQLHLHNNQKSKVELQLVTNFDEMVLLADNTYVHRALGNLLSNACKYTYRGSIEIKVLYSPRTEALDIIITDTGVGMSKEKLNSLFSKKDHQDRNKKGSFGFGLMICKAIVDQADGTIQVDSTEGVGTSVHITIRPEVLSWSRK